MSFCRTCAALRLGTVCLALLSLVPQVQAQGNDEADNLFRNLDSNKDGKLTSADGTTGNRQLLNQVFEMAGKPQSGTVSREEFQQVFERHRARRGGNNPPPNPQPGSPDPGARPPRDPRPDDGLPPFLRQLDSNSDQRLTRTELGRINQMFERLDTNKDGALDSSELRSAAEAPENSPAPETRSGPPERTNRSRNTTDRATDARAADAGTGVARLAGVWRGWVVDGRGENPDTGQMQIELTIEGNRISGREVGTRRAPEGIGGGTFTMTGTTTGNLDADGTSGPQDGRHFMGVYELQGDTLRWCVGNRGRQRPQVMATDRGNYLMVLRKQ